VNFELSDEQQMLREAAVNALARIDTVAGAREALDQAALPDLWTTATEAGWAGLLIPEEHGGVGPGVFDAMLVQEECGKRLAGTGLLGHLPATIVLTRAAEADDARAAELLPALAGGPARAAIVHHPPGSEAAPRFDGEAGTVSGIAEFQPDAAGAGHLVVSALDGEEEPCAVLVDSGAAGVQVEEIVRYDSSRPLGNVKLDGAAAHTLAAGAAELEEAWHVAQSLLASDALGVAQTMLDLSVSYAKDRHAFGRPIGSYQAIKQQIVEILRHAETTRNLCFYAGFAADSSREELPLAANAARFAGEQASDYATRTCIAVHGGIGATWEHDAPLYWRRAQLSRLLLGGVAGAGDAVAEEILQRARRQADAVQN